MAELEAQFVSFERCWLLTEIPQEAAQRLPIDKNWVKEGKVEFWGFSVWYWDNTELVLKDLNFTV